ncbi:MAG: MoxR family ATPase [Candidatus Dormibacteraeota bacterium]|nr:MoxR family ATPase [Candidatus Dormibacteraeota bacterium]
MTKLAETKDRLLERASRVLVGPTDNLELCLLAMVVGGHVLLEGFPGTAKTLLAKTLARLTDARYARVQFTPDLLPADIVGTVVYNQAKAAFEVRPGPVFTDLLLADEINRSPAKTQAALLEAMEERQVTLDGRSYPLGDRFTVLATQNPIELEGTFPLPEAELDRFLMKLEISYLPPEGEQRLARMVDRGFDPHSLAAELAEPVLTRDSLAEVRREVLAVKLSDEVLSYLTQVVQATRDAPELAVGASSRATVALVHLAKARAAAAGRDFVEPDDVKEVCLPVLRHRVQRRPEVEMQGVGEREAISRVLARVPVPR